MNYTIFDLMYPKYKIKKPIRLIEFFAGYGSQALALKYLNVPFEHYKICEWAVKSIQAYNDVHVRDYKNYSSNLSDNEILDKLLNYGVSINYNTPATKNQLKNQNYRNIFNNIIATNNLVNIQNTHGKDLNIINKDKYDYILTYSFPCQDLSKAGKKKGMSDTSTRSGMLWEVERILTELNVLNQLPQILLMENVPQVHSQENIKDFNKWQLSLEKLGYQNYLQDLIATDYGIPQLRNRCFMISILGNYNYSFPQQIKSKNKLQNLLEENVSNKYLLKDLKLLQHIENTKKETKNYTKYDRYNGALEQHCRIWKNVAPTLTTKSNDIKIYDHEIIRYLTPKECFRLMGVKDEDFENIANSQSDSSLYHLAGDSIVVNVLMAIFKELLQ